MHSQIFNSINTRNYNKISASTFLQDVLPDYSLDKIKYLLRDCKSCTNTVRRVLNGNKALNLRTIMCIYNAVIKREIALLPAELQHSATAKYNALIIKYITLINSIEHTSYIQAMPLHKLKPDARKRVKLNNVRAGGFDHADK